MTDYEKGVEAATRAYKEVVREYVAENARLRGLERENDRLRMLARRYAQKVSYGFCDMCPYFDYSDECPIEATPRDDECKLMAEMRELGIEVDE